MSITVAYPSLQRWKKHRREWEDCKRCGLCEGAFKHVLLRGRIPADILFVGEAPGKVENTTGFPFEGRAGRLFDSLWEETEKKLDHAYSFAITNVVACIPWKVKHEEIRQPSKEEVLACSPRLLDAIEVVNPRMIIGLGKVAETYLKLLSKAAGNCEVDIPEVFSVLHPAYILRKGGEGALEFKRTRDKLAKIINNNISPF